MLFLMKRSVVLFSIINGVAGYGCPIRFYIIGLGLLVGHCEMLLQK